MIWIVVKIDWNNIPIWTEEVFKANSSWRDFHVLHTFNETQCNNYIQTMK